jgi:putative ABC transport system permease protein
MLRNMLAAALRHLARSRWYTAISVLGLAVGLCVALLVSLVVRNQYTFDHDVAGYERTYVAKVFMQPMLAQQLQTRFPQVEVAARVIALPARLERDGRVVRENIHWADASFASALPQTAYAGDVAEALRVPDGLVLSRGYARRFFGRDAPLGEALTLDGHAMVVRAVIEDPRPNATHAVRNILAAGVATFSPMHDAEKHAGMVTQVDEERARRVSVPADMVVYARLKAGADLAALQRQMAQNPPVDANRPGAKWPELTRIDRVNTDEQRHPGFHGRMTMLALLGMVVLLIATVNFANLQTARATLRAREVAIRGLVGARRHVLMIQFLGEAAIHAVVATLLAVAMAEWLLPHMNAFLDAGAVLEYGRDPWLVAALVGATLLFSLIAGAWPALVLSRFRPGVALRGGAVLAVGGARVRQMLVTLQFSLLIALVICAGVVNRQHEFALNEALRVDHDQVLLVHAPLRSTVLRDEVRKLPGVRNVTRSSGGLLGRGGFAGARGGLQFTFRDPAGEYTPLLGVEVDFDLFDFYGVKPLAGTLPVADGTHQIVPSQDEYVINESAARRFGLGSPAEAVGKELVSPPRASWVPASVPPDPPNRVVAVVPDFSLDSVAEGMGPLAYFQPTNHTNETQADVLSVRLKGQQIPETLNAIDELWSRLGNAETGGVAGRGPSRMFLDEHFERRYLAMLRQFQAFSLCALIAIVLSGIGLFALTAATAERRTKEIGIRKALGANTSDVLKLLLWQFTKPVVWANLLAWPVAGYLMQRWLDGFAYHVDLPLWLFPATGVAALLIALATVTTQALAVARSKPVVALRYE